MHWHCYWQMDGPLESRWCCVYFPNSIIFKLINNFRTFYSATSSRVRNRAISLYIMTNKICWKYLLNNFVIIITSIENWPCIDRPSLESKWSSGTLRNEFQFRCLHQYIYVVIWTNKHLRRAAIINSLSKVSDVDIQTLNGCYDSNISPNF